MPISPPRACNYPGCPETTREQFCADHNRSRCAVTLVCGPPGSGKTTYVRKRKQAGDLVVDLDDIYAALTWDQRRDHLAEILPFACAARDAVIDRLTREHSVKTAWVIACMPNSLQRSELARRLSAHTVVLEVPAAQCLQQIAKSGRNGPVNWQRLVDEWWSEYTPLYGEEHSR